MGWMVVAAASPASLGEPSLYFGGEALRMAQGGTLVLDGVERLSRDDQATLFHVLEAQGGRSPRGGSPQGVRVVALSSTDLESDVAAGRFLAVLRGRLAALQIAIPPLRERAGDLYVLTCHFLRELSPPGQATPELTPAAWRALHDYRFPGNVGELRRVLERALAASNGRTIGPEHLGAEVARG
jgi:DNA-binding NtrC family response regulator